MRPVFEFWRRCFDFKGRMSRDDFRESVFLLGMIGFLINIIEVFVLVLVYNVSPEQAIRGFFYMAYSIFGLIALVAMSFRRLRDGGYLNKSAWLFLIPILGLMRLMWCLFFEESEKKDHHE